MKTINTEFTNTKELQKQLTQEINKQITDSIISYASDTMDIYKIHKTIPVDESYIYYLPLTDVPLISNYDTTTIVGNGRYYCETQPYGCVSIESYFTPFISMGLCCNV